MIALLLLLLSADPVPREFRVQRFDFEVTIFDGGWQSLGTGYKYGAMIGGTDADGGVLELESCPLTPLEYARVKRVVEQSGARCLAGRTP